MGERQDSRARKELVDVFVVASRALVGLAVRSIESAPIDISLPGWRVVVVLDTRGPQPIGTLADVLGVHPSNASRLCTRLDGLGLTTRRRADADGRVVEVSLTERGHAFVGEVMAARRKEIEAVLGRMEVDDARATVAALEAFAEATHEPMQDWHDPWVEVADPDPRKEQPDR